MIRMIDFRDECAIRILQGLLSSPEVKTTINAFFTHGLGVHNNEVKARATSKVENLVKASYVIADMMRKEKLSFID